MPKTAAPTAIVATVLCLCPLAIAQEASVRAPAPRPAAEPNPASAVVLDLRQALARARQSGPVTSLARLRIAEAESKRVDAEVFPRENPLFEVGFGPRFVAEDLHSPYVTLALSQSLHLGGGRAARIRAADAGVAAARAETDADAQAALREAATSFLRALWAAERAKVAEQALESAHAAAASAKTRQQAGEVTMLEVNVARTGVARAAAALRSLEAEREAALGRLRVLLGVPPTGPLELRGSLADPILKDARVLDHAAGSHPELRALRGELEAARAQEDLADALAWPEIGLGAAYQLEDNNVHTVYGTLSLTLPLFARSQGLGAEARARHHRAEKAAAATRARVEGEVATAVRVLARRAEAVQAFEEDRGATSYRDNLALAARQHTSGETGLGALILIQRELIEAEADRLDKLLELRLTEAEALAAAGALP